MIVKENQEQNKTFVKTNLCSDLKGFGQKGQQARCLHRRNSKFAAAKKELLETSEYLLNFCWMPEENLMKIGRACYDKFH